ncbi:MAG: exosortase-associated EpsI family protein [Janthinobacterium lividum]
MPHICRMGYLLALLIGSALLTAMVWKPSPPKQYAGLSGQDIPRLLDGYAAGPDDVIPADVRAALASATLTSRTYQVSGSDSVQNEASFSFVLIGGTDRSALHDPRSCLIGAGMQVENDHLERLPGTRIEARACHAIVGTSGAGADMIYLYLVNGRVINDATRIRVAMLWSALLGQRGTPVYFLRFTRSLESDPRQDSVDHVAMLKFASEMWTQLQPKLLSTTG